MHVCDRPAAEALPQAPAAPANLDRDCDGPDGAGPSEGDTTALPSKGRPLASRRWEKGRLHLQKAIYV